LVVKFFKESDMCGTDHRGKESKSVGEDIVDEFGKIMFKESMDSGRLEPRLRNKDEIEQQIITID